MFPDEISSLLHCCKKAHRFIDYYFGRARRGMLHYIIAKYFSLQYNATLLRVSTLFFTSSL